MDEWFDVPLFPALEITKYGKVRAKQAKGRRKTRWGNICDCIYPARILRHGSQHGYPVVRSRRTGNHGPIYVHRLMALTFVAGYEKGYHVNHINGVKSDFRPENLEWVPNEENVRHAHRNGLCGASGEDSHLSKLTWKKVSAIRRALALGVTPHTISVICDLCHGTIDKIARGETWKQLREESPDGSALSPASGWAVS